jgi:hypothetical protein
MLTGPRTGDFDASVSHARRLRRLKCLDELDRGGQEGRCLFSRGRKDEVDAT